jgi:16S rRNA processing protein RimM
MNDLVKIGQIVSTHGIKGELKIISNFEQKNKVFIPEFKLYFDTEEFVIISYRPHKQYDMVVLKGLNDINQVLKYKGKDVYIARQDLHLKTDEYLLCDLVGMSVTMNDKIIGKVKLLVYNNANILMEINAPKKFYIPYNEHFIIKVDLAKNEIEVKNIEGLIV